MSLLWGELPAPERTSGSVSTSQLLAGRHFTSNTQHWWTALPNLPWVGSNTFPSSCDPK